MSSQTCPLEKLAKEISDPRKLMKDLKPCNILSPHVRKNLALQSLGFNFINDEVNCLKKVLAR